MRISLLLLNSILMILGSCRPGYAERIRNRYTPISTLTDEREVKTINDNFKRLMDTGVVISSSGYTVPVGVSRSTVTFETPQPDVNYAAIVTPSWMARFRVLQKTTTGFILEYDTASVQSSFDFIVTR